MTHHWRPLAVKCLVAMLVLLVAPRAANADLVVINIGVSAFAHATNDTLPFEHHAGLTLQLIDPTSAADQLDISGSTTFGIPYFANAFASADAVAHQLKILLVGSGGQATGSASARAFMEYQGVIEGPCNVTSGPGCYSFPVNFAVTGFVGGLGDPLPYIEVSGTGGGASAFLEPGSIDVILSYPVLLSGPDTNFNMRAILDGFGRCCGITDFSHTATLSLGLAPGQSYTTGSTVFVGAVPPGPSPVPLPGTAPLMGLGLLVLGAVRKYYRA